MKKAYLLLLTLFTLFTACRKNDTPSADICLHDSSVSYLKRWSNVYTQVTTYNTDGSVQKSKIAFGHGYFQINLDYTYNLFSDGTPENGKWLIDKNCQFVLNTKGGTERKFTVTQLSADSLTLREKIGNTVYTEHLATFTCPELPFLQFRWDNVSILETKYDGKNVMDTKYNYPVGYFKLNPDATYNVVSNGVPFNGTWGISQPGCLLVLDKNKSQERSFDVQKLTKDSLVIWRKDTVKRINYLQYYKKH